MSNASHGKNMNDHDADDATSFRSSSTKMMSDNRTTNSCKSMVVNDQKEPKQQQHNNNNKENDHGTDNTTSGTRDDGNPHARVYSLAKMNSTMVSTLVASVSTRPKGTTPMALTSKSTTGATTASRISSSIMTGRAKAGGGNSEFDSDDKLYDNTFRNKEFDPTAIRKYRQASKRKKTSKASNLRMQSKRSGLTTTLRKEGTSTNTKQGKSLNKNNIKYQNNNDNDSFSDEFLAHDDLSSSSEVSSSSSESNSSSSTPGNPKKKAVAQCHDIHRANKNDHMQQETNNLYKTASSPSVSKVATHRKYLRKVRFSQSPLSGLNRASRHDPSKSVEVSPRPSGQAQRTRYATSKKDNSDGDDDDDNDDETIDSRNNSTSSPTKKLTKKRSTRRRSCKKVRVSPQCGASRHTKATDKDDEDEYEDEYNNDDEDEYKNDKDNEDDNHDEPEPIDSRNKSASSPAKKRSTRRRSFKKVRVSPQCGGSRLTTEPIDSRNKSTSSPAKKRSTRRRSSVRVLPRRGASCRAKTSHKEEDKQEDNEEQEEDNDYKEEEDDKDDEEEDDEDEDDEEEDERTPEKRLQKVKKQLQLEVDVMKSARTSTKIRPHKLQRRERLLHMVTVILVNKPTKYKASTFWPTVSGNKDHQGDHNFFRDLASIAWEGGTEEAYFDKWAKNAKNREEALKIKYYVDQIEFGKYYVPPPGLLKRKTVKARKAPKGTGKQAKASRGKKG